MRYGTRPNPTRDWLVLLTISIMILAGIIIWNMWAFSTVVSGGVIGNSVTNTPQILNQSSFDTIRIIFKNREAEKEKYETGVYNFVDPSQ